MDQSASLLQTVNAYGGSDRVTPSFNRTQYVRYGSVHGPKDLGAFAAADLVVSGVVGSESGAPTLFFRFTLTEAARIGVEPHAVNSRTDPYLQYELRSLSADTWLRVEDHPVVSWQESSSETEVFDLGTGINTAENNRYVVLGYWDIGYAEGDDGSAPENIKIVQVIRDSIEVAYPSADYSPAGTYLLTISGSQWPQLPFAFRLLTRPTSKLTGEATVDPQGSNRLTLQRIGGESDAAVLGEGRLRQKYLLSSDATIAATGAGALRVSSPLG